ITRRSRTASPSFTLTDMEPSHAGICLIPFRVIGGTSVNGDFTSAVQYSISPACPGREQLLVQAGRLNSDPLENRVATWPPCSLRRLALSDLAVFSQTLSLRAPGNGIA